MTILKSPNTKEQLFSEDSKYKGKRKKDLLLVQINEENGVHVESVVLKIQLGKVCLFVKCVV